MYTRYNINIKYKNTQERRVNLWFTKSYKSLKITKFDYFCMGLLMLENLLIIINSY